MLHVLTQPGPRVDVRVGCVEPNRDFILNKIFTRMERGMALSIKTLVRVADKIKKDH